jgi:glycosyltransferase involved in cell wall biosynthesis
MRAPDKGSVCVVEAMKIVWQRHPSARLVLAGPSLSAFDLYLSTASAGCERLLTLGPVSDAEKRDWLAAATVVVQPSRVESLGLILLEAWANEKPVIAADTAVSRELVAHGRDGLLVPFGNNSRLAHAITQLLQDSSSRRAMGIRGREKLMRCLGDNWLAKTLPLFSTRKPYTFTM